MKRQKNSYTVEKKQKAVELARHTSNSYIAKYYSLDLTMLGRWVNKFFQNPPSSSSLKNTKSIGSGRHALFSEKEAQLFYWIIGVCQNGLAVTYPNIKFKMAEILDKTHITDPIKAALHLRNTDLAIISGGLTSMCQPLDICINKLFKDKLRKSWYIWMVNGSNSITKKRNLKHANLKTVCDWVLKAWEDISEDVIIHAFKKCSISNCLLGSEDHLIYDDDDENNSNKNLDNNESEVKKEESNKELDKNEESDENNETGNENEESDKNNETGDEMDK
ncbi:26084_t:CDS:2 [Gigaspora margarita]|uniref:26084_t:CDS:1 n=1 Tax=Gigaspora margarita TaxID=4874 RepID=A0ABN7VXR0_GIGMA|nr:26084_t:CDS:2 [Gigaspora margarita]